jgi:hypothetical protein
MANLAFADHAENYYCVDIMTHNLDTKFNMPNVVSIERLTRFYNDDKNYFVILLVSYTIKNGKPLFQKCTFVPIEYFSWHCLTLGALGWGQIQIINSNAIDVNMDITRKEWMLQFCDVVDEFYTSERMKINQREEHFRDVKEFWERQPD